MKIRITKPQHLWHHEFRGKIFEVCEGYNPNHPQYPVMTKYGRTWFDFDACTIIEE